MQKLDSSVVTSDASDTGLFSTALVQDSFACEVLLGAEACRLLWSLCILMTSATFVGGEREIYQI